MESKLNQKQHIRISPDSPRICSMAVVWNRSSKCRRLDRQFGQRQPKRFHLQYCIPYLDNTRHQW
jgi:hypothetical protein